MCSAQCVLSHDSVTPVLPRKEPLKRAAELVQNQGDSAAAGSSRGRAACGSCCKTGMNIGDFAISLFLVDVLLTCVLLAGGADFIHRIMSAATKFFDARGAKAKAGAPAS